MEKIKSLLTSKRFWTLIAAIVAALSAFFASSCSVQAKVQREGIHIDTVRVDYIVRSRNFQTLAVCPSTNQFDQMNLSSIREFFQFTPVSGAFTVFAPLMTLTELRCTGTSIPPILASSNISLRCSGLSNISRSITPASSNLLCSIRNLTSSSDAECSIFGAICLAASVPIVLPSRSRRGGRRKGRPRPGIKSVPLGGSHL